MRNFDTDLDRRGVTRMSVTVPSVTASVIPEREARIAQPRSTKSFLVKGDQWDDWRDLRDYVVHEIEQRFGPFPRDDKKEIGIFKSFVGRWGIEDSQRIARYAFDMLDGRWGGAPISIFRFAKNSDPYFAEKIHEYLSGR